MNIYLDNVNLASTSGPNSFARKLVKYGTRSGLTFERDTHPDAYLCFIEARKSHFDAPMFQRVDGIYFNTHFGENAYLFQNSNIKRTYDMATGIIFQSEFNRELTTKYFGDHPNTTVIHNGADTDMIAGTKLINNITLDSFENIWSCASQWRPHKRLSENIRYFLEHSGEKECLVIAGQYDGNDPEQFDSYFDHDRIFYIGNVPPEVLVALYKRSKYFLHLAWLDHCPNVVVDARASGCTIVCSSAGGTKEVAGRDAIVIEEEEWDMKPVDLYKPPRMHFEKIVDNLCDLDFNMIETVEKYKRFMTAT